MVSLGIVLSETEKLEKKGKYEPRHEKTCLFHYANNKGADQTAHTVWSAPLLFAA